jgi:threonine dehydratase
VPATEAITQLLHDVLTSRVYDVARETPLDPAQRPSRRFGNTILFKREDLRAGLQLQAPGLQQDRPPDGCRKSRGIIAASAGNHAQAWPTRRARWGCAP